MTVRAIRSRYEITFAISRRDFDGWQGASEEHIPDLRRASNAASRQKTKSDCLRPSSGSLGAESLAPLNPRRAPKVTVTRERVSLCQKGVTPWLLFVLPVPSLRSKLKGAGGRAACPTARAPLRSKVRWASGSRLTGGAQHSVSLRLICCLLPWPHLPCRRIAEIAFMLRVTASFNANGFKCDLCCRSRCLVASATSALANTLASGVWATP